jgi:hypothetical protein
MIIKHTIKQTLLFFILDNTLAANRRKLVPPLPNSCSFDIPDSYKLTINRERFLLFDESRARRERLLLYGSDLQLNLLFDSQTVYMDGTFSKAPPYFMQVFIIHAINFDTCEKNKYHFLEIFLIVFRCTLCICTDD